MRTSLPFPHRHPSGWARLTDDEDFRGHSTDHELYHEGYRTLPEGRRSRLGR